MENLFALLVLTSLVLLIIGLFSPKTSLFWYKNERTKLKSGIIYGVVLLASSLFFNSASDGKKEHTKTKEVTNNYVFDVPSIIGLNIDSVKKVLGNPITSVETIEPSKKELKSGVKEWTNYFDKGVYELQVRFNPITRNVRNIFILSRDTTNHEIDYESLLRIYNLSEDDAKYSIEKMILNNNQLSGIVIWEKTTDHSSAAYTEAVELTKKMLNYPEEAKFDWTPSYDKNEGENNYRIVGTVVVKNGFGVKQKKIFKCVLHYNGGDDLEDNSWDVVENISLE